MKSHNKLSQSNLTPALALQLLKDGNDRFVQNLRFNRNLLQQVNETKEGQWPFAAIVSCMDSRTSAELIFDQGLGDIFSIRLAGAVISDNVIGSLEYACKVAGSKIIVVLGHTQCGAIKGACDDVQLGNLTALLNKIRPSVLQEKTITEDRTSKNPNFVNAVTNLHTERSVKSIMEHSSILSDMVEKEEIGIIGALYNVEKGTVTFMDHTSSIQQVVSVSEMVALEEA
jgi:carbonic anhydrase